MSCKSWVYGWILALIPVNGRLHRYFCLHVEESSLLNIMYLET